MKATFTSDWVTIAASGATVDGRKLDAEVLRSIAESYDPDFYGARINIEHMRNWEKMGSVVALQVVDNPKRQGGVLLQAKVNPNRYFFYLLESDQHIFWSIEYTPKFADTDKPYLVGLALTDQPASTNTQPLRFSSTAEMPTEVFTYTPEDEMEFNLPKWGKKPEASESAGAESFSAALDGKFATFQAAFTEAFTARAQEFADEQGAALAKLSAENAEIKAQLSASEKSNQELRKEFAALKESVENTPAPDRQRPPATGGSHSYGADAHENQEVY